jgi:hypothetical protein
MRMATTYMQIERQYKRRQLARKILTIVGHTVAAGAIGTVIAIVIQGAL